MKQHELIALFQQNRETAFRQIYRVAFPKVAKLIAHRGGSFEEAKDIFHEALIILYEKCQAETLQIKGSVVAYVVGMCRNQWLSKLRNQNKEVLTDDFSSCELKYEEHPLTDQTATVLGLLERAGKKCLDMLQAVYYFKYSMQEVAEEFGFRSVRSATVQKYKCLEKIRNTVKREQDESILA